MSKILSVEDRLAVDLILDKSLDSQHRETNLFVPPDQGVATQRLQAVETLLHTLNALPAEEPSPDLIARTLRRIEHSRSAVPIESSLNAMIGETPIA